MKLVIAFLLSAAFAASAAVLTSQPSIKTLPPSVCPEGTVLECSGCTGPPVRCTFCACVPD